MTYQIPPSTTLHQIQMALRIEPSFQLPFQNFTKIEYSSLSPKGSKYRPHMASWHVTYATFPKRDLFALVLSAVKSTVLSESSRPIKFAFLVTWVLSLSSCLRKPKPTSYFYPCWICTNPQCARSNHPWKPLFLGHFKELILCLIDTPFTSHMVIVPDQRISGVS